MNAGRKADTLESLLDRAREARWPDEGSAAFQMPPGFPERVVSKSFAKPPEPLLIWMKMGYGGLAAALVLALAITVLPREPSEENAADLWMNLET
jgi:hypothetical protein